MLLTDSKELISSIDDPDPQTDRFVIILMFQIPDRSAAPTAGASALAMGLRISISRI